MRKHVRCAMVAIALAGLTLTTAKAQEKEEEKLSFTLSLNHDAFFGFNPMLSGAYILSDKAALTFYGIQWGQVQAQLGETGRNSVWELPLTQARVLPLIHK